MDTIVGKKVLIVEDEYLLAMELTRHFSTLGVEVVGPVPDMERAVALLSAADAAILDINLNGVLVFPLADELAKRNMPFVFISGYDDTILPKRFHGASMLSKPASWQHVLGTAQKGLLDGTWDRVDNVVSLLPVLRLEARLIVSENNAADRLIERTLEKAVKEIERRPEGLQLATWLHRIFTEVVCSARGSVLN
jgi:CheY-like chemotaxis protein